MPEVQYETVLETTALNRTCRQLRHETNGLHLALNTYKSSVWSLPLFLRHLGADVAFVTSVCIATSAGFVTVFEELAAFYAVLRTLSPLVGLTRNVFQDRVLRNAHVLSDVKRTLGPKLFAKCSFQDEDGIVHV